MKKCECGCGQIVKKGNRFVNGHNRKGKKRVAREERTCLCGKVFTVRKTSTKKYCSTECTRKYCRIGKSYKGLGKGRENTWNKLPRKIIKCLNCGKDLIVIDRPNEKNKKFCNIKCYKEAEKKGLVRVGIPEKIGKTLKALYKTRPFKLKGMTYEEIMGKKKADKRKKEIGENTCRVLARGGFPQTNTLPHRMLVKAMKKNNLWKGFENEVQVGHFVIDVADKPRKIAIQVDGDYWHCHPEKYKNGPINKTQKYVVERDKKCNIFLELQNYKVLRFWERDIKNNIEEILKKIKGEIDCLVR